MLRINDSGFCLLEGALPPRSGDEETEEWRRMEGSFTRYEVSNQGGVRRISKSNRESRTLLIGHANRGQGLPSVLLQGDGRSVGTVKMPRELLVAEYWLPRPDANALIWLHHLDGDQRNCWSDNLAWASRPDSDLPIGVSIEDRKFQVKQLRRGRAVVGGLLPIQETDWMELDVEFGPLSTRHTANTAERFFDSVFADTETVLNCYEECAEGERNRLITVIKMCGEAQLSAISAYVDSLI